MSAKAAPRNVHLSIAEDIALVVVCPECRQVYEVTRDAVANGRTETLLAAYVAKHLHCREPA